jgi:hypothetical protein
MTLITDLGSVPSDIFSLSDYKNLEFALLGLVEHTCNLSYLGGGGKKIMA